MAYRVDDLITDCAAAAGDATVAGGASQTRRAKLFGMSMPGLSISTFDSVWNAVLQSIRSNMKMHRGTKLPSFGRVVFTKGTKVPFFVMSEGFSLPHKIKFRQDIKAPELASVDLNFSKIGQLAKCTKDVAKSVYREMVSRLGEVISDANNTVHVEFKGVGVLHGNRFDLRFRFGTGSGGARARRADSVASFTKDAPESAAGLSVVAGLSSAMAAQPQVSARSSQRSLRSQRPASGSSLSASASAPALRKGLSVSSTLKAQRQGSRGGGSRRGSRENVAAKAHSKPKRRPLNSLVAKKGHDPAYLNLDQLKEINMDLMTDKQAEDEAMRLADEKEFRENVLRLHAEATKEAEEIEKERVRREAFTQQQAVHAERVMARKFEERNAGIEDQETHWPFSKEEDERARKQERSQQLRDTLDRHVELQESIVRTDSLERPAREARPVAQPDPDDSKTWFKPSEGNIYPKFLTPSLVPSRIAGSFQATPVMKLGYERYAVDLKKELGNLKRQEDEIKTRAQAQEDEIKRRARLRKTIQANTIKYQAKQVAFDRTRRQEEHRRQFLEMDPDPSAAYPMERMRDMNRLDRIKAGLRNALDAQVSRLP